MQLIVGARVLTQNYFLGIPGTILSLIAVCAGSFVTSLLLNVNKQVEGKIRMIREQRKKSCETRGESRKVAYTCKYYISGHLIPHSVMQLHVLYE